MTTYVQYSIEQPSFTLIAYLSIKENAGDELV